MLTEAQDPFGTWVRERDAAPHCPYCDRVMSKREAAEQGACNDCTDARLPYARHYLIERG